MEARVIGANVLPLVEKRFRFLIDEYGFTLAQTTDIPTGAWYRSPRGAVVVSYDMMRDAAVDVKFEIVTTAETHSLCELLQFHVPGIERRPDAREPAAFHAELDRMAQLLAEHCAEFLHGDVHAFVTRYREALLVKRCRQIASEEAHSGDPRRAVRLWGAFRSYWSDSDRDVYETLTERCRQAAYERRTGARVANLRLLR